MRKYENSETTERHLEKDQNICLDGSYIPYKGELCSYNTFRIMNF